MRPSLRKLALTAHIVFSVGWLGAVVPYLALSIAGLTSNDAQMVRAAYLSMELIGWYVIVPLSLGALVSGIVQSLGTPWGLFRHWWIVAKLLLTATATALLLTHMQAVSHMSGIAANATWAGVGFGALRVQLVAHAAGGLLLLLTVTGLSVFKPWGLTSYGGGWLSQTDLPRTSASAGAKFAPAFPTGMPRWIRIVGIHAIALLLLFVVLHIVGGGLGHHGH